MAVIKLLLISSTVTDLLNIDACTLYAKLVKPVDVRIMLLLRVNVTGTNF